jgi:hypothetical protein
MELSLHGVVLRHMGCSTSFLQMLINNFMEQSPSSETNPEILRLS